MCAPLVFIRDTHLIRDVLQVCGEYHTKVLTNLTYSLFLETIPLERQPSGGAQEE